MPWFLGAPSPLQDREKVGKIQHFSHVIPTYYLHFPHNLPISTFFQHLVLIFPRKVPFFVHYSMSSLQFPHLEVNIFSTLYHLFHFLSTCVDFSCKFQSGECVDVLVKLGKQGTAHFVPRLFTMNISHPRKKIFHSWFVLSLSISKHTVLL